MDLIEKMSELKVIIDKLGTKYPEFSELVPLINDLIFRCISIINALIEVYSITEASTRDLIFSNDEFKNLDLNSALIKKFINVLSDSEDLDDALSRVSSDERGLLIDALKILRKRGLLDFDVEYDGKVRVRLIRRPGVHRASPGLAST
ncbi:hypothetical protein [Vulcanisaeta thermophila]|uniref:hypothetical protein n=1 Tax=Vulcanisaeta thermophila TaxID=867917 RepID=UPI000852D19E|nr:hypothetical protein [Vulcanisaeta thermophila]